MIPFPFRSNKYKEIIFNNAVIRPESPMVLRLVPRKERTGTLTRFTVGNKSPEKENRTVLLVGETGSGKSTLINALFNFFLGVKWDENIWFEIVDKDERNLSDSDTSDVTVYEINEGEALGFSLTVIDTPGFGDTRGTEKDQLLAGRLLELFSSDAGVSEIHAVGLVLKASENRLSDRTLYVFNSVMSLFGKNMERNIVALITHSDGRKPTNALHVLDEAKIKCARDEKNEPVYFLFDNCQRDDRTDGTKYLELAHETTTRSMELFTEFLQKHKSTDLDMTKEVLEERLKLRDCITNLQKHVQLITLKDKDIQKTQEASQKYELKVENTKDFNTEEIDIYKVKKPVDSGWTKGIVSSNKAFSCIKCEETCPNSKGNCEESKNETCTDCKCPEEKHMKVDWKYVTKFRKVPKINEEKKKSNDKNKTKQVATLSKLNKLQSEKAALEESKNQFLDEAFNIIEQLEKLALNVNAMSTFVHLDFLIEKMKENGDTEKVQKLEEIKVRMDERIKAGATYLKTDKNPVEH